MNDQENPNTIHTHIWKEEPEPDNPFAARTAHCYGYDVYGDLLGKANYIEYLYLLFKGDRPAPEFLAALEVLAVALANPGPRDPSVHAAMAAGTTGNPAASVLMSAVAAGAGSYGGAREVLLAMEAWRDCGTDLMMWQNRLALPPPPSRPLFYPQIEHPPGFDPHGASCATPVRQTLAKLCQILPQRHIAWLAQKQSALEAVVGMPFGMTGVVAAAFTDIGFSPVEGEMLTLLWRLPGAAVHALEQWQRGFRQFPFFEMDVENDPGPISREERA